MFCCITPAISDQTMQVSCCKFLTCLSFHILALGKHIWDNEMSTRTESLDLTVFILPLISHILVFIWVGYTVSHYVMLQCGYSPRHERVLTRLRMIASQYFHRNREGYQALSGATSYGNPRQVMAATKLMKQFPTTPNDAVPPFF